MRSRFGKVSAPQLAAFLVLFLLSACQRQRPLPRVAIPQTSQLTLEAPPAPQERESLPTAPPTETPTPADTATPTPSPTPPPEAFWPVLPPIDGAMKQRLRAVYDLGQARGTRAGVFIKVGDSISASGAFLTDLGCGLGRLGDHADLQGTIDHFAATELPAGNSSARCGRGNSFTRRGLAAVVGWSAVHVLRPMVAPKADPLNGGADVAQAITGTEGTGAVVPPPDASSLQATEVVSGTAAIAEPTAGPPPECVAPDDTPLRCEILVTRPAVALVMYGTNDLEAGVDLASFRHNMDMIVGQLLDAGVIPVLSTIPPRPRQRRANARVSGFNQVVKAVADERGVPLWNYWAQLAGPDVINHGISGDGVHPSALRYGGDFSPQGLRYGYNQRSLGALQMLDKVLRVVIQDGPAEG